MSRSKIDSNPFGLFPHADEKSLEDNLFHLLSLYDILIKQSINLIPDEQRKAEFIAAHKLIDGQRRAYKQNADRAKNEERDDARRGNHDNSGPAGVQACCKP